jgi:hypothetical protein
MLSSWSAPPSASGTTWSATVAPGWQQTWHTPSCRRSTRRARACRAQPLTPVLRVRSLPGHARVWVVQYDPRSVSSGQPGSAQTFTTVPGLGRTPSSHHRSRCAGRPRGVVLDADRAEEPGKASTPWAISSSGRTTDSAGARQSCGAGAERWNTRKPLLTPTVSAAQRAPGQDDQEPEQRQQYETQLSPVGPGPGERGIGWVRMRTLARSGRRAGRGNAQDHR